MRLDHLLSKEHLASRLCWFVQTSWWMFMPPEGSGWNTDYSIDADAGTVSTAVRGVEILCKRMRRLGTLLGPEGSVALCVDSLRDDSRRTAS